ncbi:MAG: ribonuclease HI [Defluviitaleaceae bacterium]|nr:ribonuclease HI [Defluviitaleaceae bacterium]
MKAVEIYTDGACSGNPGPGGYGAVLMYKGTRRELSGAYALTTNNRMEILAAIKALQALSEPCDVSLYSDSRYLVDAVEKGWAKKWRANNWMRNKTDRAVNVDLWQDLLLLLEYHRVKLIWVKGHASNPENERCDYLATSSIGTGNFERDIVYETTVQKT